MRNIKLHEEPEVGQTDTIHKIVVEIHHAPPQGKKCFC